MYALPAMPLPAAAAVSRSLQRQRHRQAHMRKWARRAPAGLVSVGLGLSLAGEATLRKGRGQRYAALGTLALCAVGAGLSLIGDAVKHAALADVASGEA